MASESKIDLPPKQWKLLAMLSGNRCAFPGCGSYLAIPGEPDEPDVVIGVAAHIVAASRQGPRGDFVLSVDERDRSSRNRILLCPAHHTLVDSRPRTYTVQVLRKMKLEHERGQLPTAEGVSAPENVTETLRSSLLSVTAIPGFVMSLPLKEPSQREGDVAKGIRWPERRDEILPFIVREKRLYTFADLTTDTHAFVDLTEPEEPQVEESIDLWNSDEGHRRYVALLNKSLMKFLGRRGLRFDRDHRRYWFMAEPGPAPRSISYRSKSGRQQHREVVRQRVRRSTGELKEWWHVAAGLRFERVGDRAWVLSIRPEFQFTSDGMNPLPPKIHSAKSARRKGKLYNEQFLDLLHFWLEFLLADQPRLTLRVADQRVVLEGNLSPGEVEWPGVPGDRRSYSPRAVPENLFTAFEVAEVEELLPQDGWHDEDEDHE